jgi:hypothetical protein
MTFEKIEASSIILQSRGVFREACLYLLKDDVYAKYGTGFVRLYASGRTTTILRWSELECYDREINTHKMGYLVAGKMVKTNEPTTEKTSSAPGNKHPKQKARPAKIRRDRVCGAQSATS